MQFFCPVRSAVCISVLCCCGLLRPAAAQQSQWRGLWADCFHSGFKSTAEIDDLVNRAVIGKYNAIVAEVMGYQDRGSPGHGAYWSSNIVPRATDVSAGLDPLAYLCQRAAVHGIQVHAWLVTYRVSSSWPPAGNSVLAAHPEYLMVSSGGIDSDPIWKIGGDYVLDPGSPDVQEYLVSIARELVTNYPIHGINWDYIRYTQYDAGYPARSSYDYSGLKRFQRIYNRSDIPSYSDTQWNDFRRRTIDELVRRCRAEIAVVSTNPNQPVMQTADVFATGYAPSSFTSSQAYRYFQNWKLWAESGWLDAVIPMNYKRDHCSDEYSMYRGWIDKIVQWKGPRHAYCGQGNYLNSMSNSVAQMQYVFSKGAEGAANYSYHATRADETICDDNDGWSNDTAWYSYVSSPGRVYANAATVPPLPWRNPATATEGTIWGQIVNFWTGQPVDDAAVTVSGMPAVRTDGNGYYTVTLVPATAAGTSYPMSIFKAGVGSMSYPSVTIYAGDAVRYDFLLGAPAPQIVLDPTTLDAVIPKPQVSLQQVFTVSAAAGRGFLNYTVSEQLSWLSVSPTSGISTGEADAITVTYDTTGLTPGTHTGTINVYDPGAINSPSSITVTLHIPRPCDFDLDDDVDQEDFARLQNCLTGVGVLIADPNCNPVDLDSDLDVDEFDVEKFRGCLSGPNQDSDPLCLN